MDSLKENKPVKKPSLSAQVAAGIIPASKPVKKPSLSAQVRKCFFGFNDATKEEHFTMLKAKERIPVLMMISVVGCASAVYRAWHFADWISNPLGSLLMDSVGPQSLAISLFPRIFKGTWRWLEPTVLWWAGPLASMATFFCFSFFLAAANYVSNPHAGHPPPPTDRNRGNSASFVSPGRPRGAGGPNPGGSLVKFFGPGSTALPSAHQVKHFIVNRIKLISKVLRRIVDRMKQIPAVPKLLVNSIEEIPEVFHSIAVLLSLPLSLLLSCVPKCS
eukprot:gene22595-29734_t